MLVLKGDGRDKMRSVCPNVTLGIDVETSDRRFPSNLTTSFSADQMIQFARAVVLELWLASHNMLEDLLMKTRVGSGDQPVISPYPAGKSLFPKVAGSSMGVSFAPQSVFSLPTITDTEGTNVVVSGDVLEEPCSSRQADARLATGPEGSETPGTDSLKILQQIRSNEKKWHMSKWSGEGRLSPLLPSGDD